uniref:Uncharacterized protein n=1 Tax=Kalanchoe fedtschenkoi TaxID=63787 RepID=A0A7N0TUV5_KALFE
MVSITRQIDSILATQDESCNAHEELHGKVIELNENTKKAISVLNNELKELLFKVNLLTRVVNNTPTTREFGNLRVSEPDPMVASEVDKKFYFLEGLKPWAKTELNRQNTLDLTSAISAVERLTGGCSNDKKPRVECFLCSGSHRVAECPHKGALSALQKQSNSQKDSGRDGGDAENSLQIGALHLLSTLEKKATTSKTQTSRTLMYVDLEVNEKLTRAMIDSGATHNFVNGPEAARLGLSVEKDISTLKAVNSQARPVSGVASHVQIKIGERKGPLNFNVVALYDFEVILGMEFLRQARVVPIPFVDSLLFMGDRP